MAMYTHAARTTDVTSGNSTWELRSGATQGRLRIREIGIFLGAATASTFGLGRPVAIGVTPTTPVLGQAEDPADVAAVGATAVAWATRPTVPTTSIYHRRISLPAAIGAGVIWTWPDGPGLVIPINSSIAIYSLATNGVIDVYARWDE